jgi:type IV pilus assembly protein PilB
MRGMAADRKKLGQILKEMELIREGQIQEALTVQKEEGGVIGRILVDLGYITDDEVMFALGAQAGMDVVDLDEMDISKEIVEKLQYSVARSLNVIPVAVDGNTLTVAISDPHNVSLFDDLKFMTNMDIQGALASADAITKAIDKFYESGSAAADFTNLYAELGEDGDVELIDEKGTVDIEKAAAAANAAPVVKLLNLILMQGIKDQASDIHFEPYETEFRIRNRIDGVLYEMMPPPKHLALPLISRIKVMSNLDIAETRLPQDGRIELAIGGRPVDLRVSTLPTMFGESCVMRILDRSVVALDVENIGLRERELELLKAFINMPNGIVLVTGPTGSGKTTTLYAALNKANQICDKLITNEDPVEYNLDGIVQVQINEEVGMTYGKSLRAILRQDPDKILVGEIRDKETAQIAIEASLTGHVVFTTLHTNDAPSAVARMIDIGCEPFLIAATLEAVIAQRLVRRVCTKCKVWFTPTEEQLMSINLRPADVAGKKFAYGEGCNNCNGTGYRGRCAIFEIMMAGERIKDAIMDMASTGRLREIAREEGMRTLRESGLLAIFDGVSTIDEVLRETLSTF